MSLTSSNTTTDLMKAIVAEEKKYAAALKSDTEFYALQTIKRTLQSLEARLAQTDMYLLSEIQNARQSSLQAGTYKNA
jgi:hypothetical protein